jgi:hypothetical protein
MARPHIDPLDRRMMKHCIALSVRSGEEHEYPNGVVIRRADNLVAESTNQVAHEHDITPRFRGGGDLAGAEGARQRQPR